MRTWILLLPDWATSAGSAGLSAQNLRTLVERVVRLNRAADRSRDRRDCACDLSPVDFVALFLNELDVRVGFVLAENFRALATLRSIGEGVLLSVAILLDVSDHGFVEHDTCTVCGLHFVSGLRSGDGRSATGFRERWNLARIYVASESRA